MMISHFIATLKLEHFLLDREVVLQFYCVVVVVVVVVVVGVGVNVVVVFLVVTGVVRIQVRNR